MYFHSFKWLRSKFVKKVQRRRNKLKVANSGTLTNSQNENLLIVVDYIINITGHLLLHSHIPCTTVCLHLPYLKSQVFSRSSLNWWKLWFSCHRKASYSPPKNCYLWYWKRSRVAKIFSIVADKMYRITFFLGAHISISPKGDPLFTSHMTAPCERLAVFFNLLHCWVVNFFFFYF